MSEYDVSLLLEAINNDQRDAIDRLVPLLYREIREIAAQQMSRERKNHTSRPTASAGRWRSMPGLGCSANSMAGKIPD